jgi:superoxide dismutase
MSLDGFDPSKGSWKEMSSKELDKHHRKCKTYLDKGFSNEVKDTQGIIKALKRSLLEAENDLENLNQRKFTAQMFIKSYPDLISEQMKKEITNRQKENLKKEEIKILAKLEKIRKKQGSVL